MLRLLSLVLTAMAIFVSPSIAQKSPSEFLATLDSGVALKGVLKRKSIKVITSYGYAMVQVAKIGAIEFGESDVVLTLDQIQLRGRVDAKSFQLRSGKDRSTARRPKLVSLRQIVDGRPFGAVSFAGEWSTNYGPMSLRQEGKTITGTYGYDDTDIRGEVAGGTAKLQYRGGTVTLDLDQDGVLLTGAYESQNGGDGFWGGYRIEPKVAEPKPGEVTRGQTQSWMNYHLRVPKDYGSGKRYPAIAILHGSNMTARSYVQTIASAWPELAEKYVLVGFDGENLSRSAKPGQLAFNYSYVNFSGHEVGTKGRYRQSPALVAEALDQLKAELPIDRWFVGGHSQGGFLTYAVAMFYPDKVAGVFPMSCNLLVQCEPDFFEDKDAAFLAAQRGVPIAIIHGRNDNVVGFSGAENGLRSMIDGGFPMVRLFDHGTAAHMFARLPVPDAIQWLETLAGSDGEALAMFAEAAAKDERYRDALAAAMRAEAVAGVSAAAQKRVRAVSDRVELAAKPRAAKLAEAITADRSGGRWADEFLEFRREFAFARCARPAMAAYARLRSQHKEAANKLFYEARGIRDEAQRKAKYRELVETYYASKWYEMVKGWL